MIDTEKIYDLMSRAFSESKITWERVTEGTFENLPEPEEFTTFADDLYFAFIKITSITPEYPSSSAVWKPVYNYELSLIQKGRKGDITKKRNTLMAFANDWNKFFKKQGYVDTIENIFPSIDDVEAKYDGIAVSIQGNMWKMQPKKGRIHE